MKDIKSMIINIVNIPSTLHSNETESMYSLLQNYNYFEKYEIVQESLIREILIKNPEYINQWLQWSEDKRTSEGWYFIKNTNNKYTVGYYGSKKEIKNEYSDAANACAAFIKLDIESLRVAKELRHKRINSNK